MKAKYALITLVSIAIASIPLSNTGSQADFRKAVMKENCRMLQKILESGVQLVANCDPWSYDPFFSLEDSGIMTSETVLFRAIKCANERLVRMLIARGADVADNGRIRSVNKWRVGAVRVNSFIQWLKDEFRNGESRDELFSRREQSIEKTLLIDNGMPRVLARLICELVDVPQAQMLAGSHYRAGATFDDLLPTP